MAACGEYLLAADRLVAPGVRGVIHDFYLTLLKRGGKRGGPLSRTTARTVHRVLMKALKDLHIVVEGVRFLT